MCSVHCPYCRIQKTEKSVLCSPLPRTNGKVIIYYDSDLKFLSKGSYLEMQFSEDNWIRRSLTPSADWFINRFIIWCHCQEMMKTSEVDPAWREFIEVWLWDPSASNHCELLFSVMLFHLEVLSHQQKTAWQSVTCEQLFIHLHRMIRGTC